MTEIHPELRRTARLIPRVSFSPRTLRLVRMLSARQPLARLPVADDVTVRDVEAPGFEGAPPVRIRLYQPRPLDHPVPALLWLHGGGYILGNAEIDADLCLTLVRELGLTVASVEYRLAPEDPFPAAVDDALAALTWLHDQADDLRIRPDRVAVGGASAGGGLAAGLVLRAHDAGVAVTFQLLVYPMLDDRTVLRTDVDPTCLRMWNPASNRFAWACYLQTEPGMGEVDPSAAPARRLDLTGLPPAWIGVGTCDLFHDEDVAYATRLSEAGVDCQLHVVAGGYHAFDRISPKTAVVREFRRSYLTALRRALFAVDDASAVGRRA
jgi:acetyl esterase/lipase